jgi:hypothetical protein
MTGQNWRRSAGRCYTEAQAEERSVLAEVVERPELVDRRAQSPAGDARRRVDSYLVGAERLGMLVKKAIFAGRKPWWTT